ncbi:thiol reductase thioredoxin [Virgibacillus profundi]|uniref:Thiol reductase thioredoxin n=1 Tax=Virgibacillus profundi TaxID=2024555 RepID=A0A2A2IBA1_9BACI|nr:thioredoxin family protein [Virgibacillus profundi]PAV29281.1 thiol reductase thioredoxin [Virgibacillus profundi]PXY53450.1 thioredoxin [Virgibacillus profundi]
MKKKMLIFIGVIVVLFAALFFVTNYQNNKALEDNDNPYGTKDLDQATIDQLDNPDYGNQIMPDELTESLDSGEAKTVYFYSPVCVYCQNTTPYLVPLAEGNDIDMKKFNLLEFGNEGNAYAIESTPTLVHFEDGEEVARIVGQRSEEEFQAFFDEYVLN